MMGGDSSIYSGNGVGAASEVMLEGEKRHGEPKLPRKVVACSYCFSAGLLVFVDALPTNLKACGRPPTRG